MAGSPALVNVDAVSACAGLEVLGFEHCAALSQLAAMSGCRRFRKIYLRHCGGVSDLEFLQIDTGLSSGFKANYCSTDHYKGLKPYDFRPSWCEEHDTGFCCAWVTYSSPTHTCEEEWCYENDVCDWDLIGWGDVCFANPEKLK